MSQVCARGASRFCVSDAAKIAAESALFDQGRVLILREAVAPVPHLALFVELAIATGGRKSAICELTWDRVDFDGRLIDLGKAASKIKGRATVP